MCKLVYVFLFLFYTIFPILLEFDKAELLLYEEIAPMPPFQRKSLILLGAQGVGRRTMKNRLIKEYPSKFGTPVARKFYYYTELLLIFFNDTV